MNIIHMKYAVEVAKFGSINKASESLSMAQPNISRAIKDLEADIGIIIFDRSAKGMNLTPEGKDFIARAQNILNQINDLEYVYRGGLPNKQKFSISAPRAGYIAEAFAEFSKSIDAPHAEIVLDETGTFNTIKKVISSDCKLGIIRYEVAADAYFKEMLEKNELEYRSISTFKYAVIASKNGPLAGMDTVRESELHGLVQVTHNSPYEATLTASDAPPKEETRKCADRSVYVLDSAAQLELLSENTESFMWVSPAPKKLLDRYGLIQLKSDSKKTYIDVLIYRKGYKLSELDERFVSALESASIALK
ncbi:MAG: LysR family transcriptional regulator [Clostridia bacterium]|nr:LysR family transcriptional regulator [Clostridia bacterium]